MRCSWVHTSSNTSRDLRPIVTGLRSSMAIENGSSGFVGLARMRHCCFGYLWQGQPVGVVGARLFISAGPHGLQHTRLTSTLAVPSLKGGRTSCQTAAQHGKVTVALRDGRPIEIQEMKRNGHDLLLFTACHSIMHSMHSMEMDTNDVVQSITLENAHANGEGLSIAQARAQHCHFMFPLGRGSPARPPASLLRHPLGAPPPTEQSR